MDRPNPLGAEQLEAADVQPSKDHDRLSRFQPQDEIWGEEQIEVGIAGSEGLQAERRHRAACFVEGLHGESFSPQELVGDPLRSLAGAPRPFQPDSAGLGRRLGIDRVSAQQPRCAGPCQPVKELASAQGRHGSAFRATPEYGTSGWDYSITGYALSSSNATALGLRFNLSFFGR